MERAARAIIVCMAAASLGGKTLRFAVGDAAGRAFGETTAAANVPTTTQTSGYGLFPFSAPGAVQFLILEGIVRITTSGLGWKWKRDRKEII